MRKSFLRDEHSNSEPKLKLPIYLYTVVDDELKKEAFARELVRRIQEMRKELDLDVEEFIEATVGMDARLVSGWEDYIMRETRAEKLIFAEPASGAAGGYVKEWDIEGIRVPIGIKRKNEA